MAFHIKCDNETRSERRFSNPGPGEAGFPTKPLGDLNVWTSQSALRGVFMGTSARLPAQPKGIWKQVSASRKTPQWMLGWWIPCGWGSWCPDRDPRKLTGRDTRILQQLLRCKGAIYFGVIQCLAFFFLQKQILRTIITSLDRQPGLCLVTHLFPGGRETAPQPIAPQIGPEDVSSLLVQKSKTGGCCKRPQCTTAAQSTGGFTCCITARSSSLSGSPIRWRSVVCLGADSC